MPSFIETQEQLADSVLSFMGAPEYWRDAIGNNPKYFVHIKNGESHFFGLSKFCAFLNIQLEDYVTQFRNTTSGGITQKHISRVCEKNWTPLPNVPPDVRDAFTQWFNKITNNRLTTERISIISISEKISSKSSVTKKPLSPEDLKLKLERNELVGEIGEEVALAYEKNRLLSLGAKEDTLDIEHTSRINASAGFDIRSEYKKEKRYIEVKSSTTENPTIFISSNEINTLQKHADSAFLYIVHVTDIKRRTGYVYQEIKNPFELGFETEWLSPASFSGNPPKHKNQ